MYAGKPIIGISGGIGSGKSFVADLFGEAGCLVVRSDDHVRVAYRDPEIKQSLRSWWGDGIFDTSGEIDRARIAAKVFLNPPELQRLEQLLHPRVAQERDAMMAAAANQAQVLAFVWDIPLLFEVGLNSQCDAVVFVDADLETRMNRVQATRQWDRAELLRREKLQMPLDKKREMSDHVIRNTADVGHTRIQVRDVLSRILDDVKGRSQ